MVANIDPGLEKMMEYAKMERLNARLPPPDEVGKAFGQFFGYKYKYSLPVEDLQAQYALQALSYLRRHENVEVSQRALRSALQALKNPPKQSSPVHRDLAISAYECLCALCPQDQVLNRHLFDLVRALCSLGETSLARDYVVELKGQANAHIWSSILRGFCDERNGPELDRSLALMEEYKIPITESAYVIMAEYSASIDDLNAAKSWYERSRKPGIEGTMDTSPDDLTHTQGILLRSCIRNGHLELGHSIIRDITMTTPSKQQWDLIFEWAAGTGKGVDEIDRMMGVMEKAHRNAGDKGKPCRPDIVTINRLVELAISRKDPYTAERFIALGKNRNIEPDSHTLVLQIEYRLSVKDIGGALVAYKHLQSQDVSDDRDVPTVNKLICAMCTSGREDFDSIMNVAADLSDRRARFEPATVSALAVLHLSRNELHDVADLLNTHVFNYSKSEKASVRETLISYITGTSATTASAWDAYMIMKEIFDETPREQRTQVMDAFFQRGRADMAVHVFNHMRSHTRPDTIPTVDTYVSCFVGVARLKDHESLEVVHNQMKLDYSIEPNTRLLNSLILGYTSCNHPRRAMTFWDEIVSSREGPTLNSIHLAFRACEKSPWGDEKAGEIWARLSRTGMELDETLWASYAAGLVGNGDVQRTLRVVEEAYATGKLEMSSLM